MHVSQWVKPAIGGLLLGLILIKFPQVFGVGYGAINEALFNHLPGIFLISLVFLKIAATFITLGSGGSGGILANIHKKPDGAVCIVAIQKNAGTDQGPGGF